MPRTKEIWGESRRPAGRRQPPDSPRLHGKPRHKGFRPAPARQLPKLNTGFDSPYPSTGRPGSVSRSRLGRLPRLPILLGRRAGNGWFGPRTVFCCPTPRWPRPLPSPARLRVCVEMRRSWPWCTGFSFSRVSVVFAPATNSATRRRTRSPAAPPASPRVPSRHTPVVFRSASTSCQMSHSVNVAAHRLCLDLQTQL